MAVDRKYRGNLHLLYRWVDNIARHPKILDVIEDLLGFKVLGDGRKVRVFRSNGEQVDA